MNDKKSWLLVGVICIVAFASAVIITDIVFIDSGYPKGSNLYYLNRTRVIIDAYRQAYAQERHCVMDLIFRCNTETEVSFLNGGIR